MYKTCRNNKIYISLIDRNEIIGDINSVIIEDTCIIKYILVKNGFRNRGFGTLLLKKLIAVFLDMVYGLRTENK